MSLTQLRTLLLVTAVLSGACDARDFWGNAFLSETDPECAKNPALCKACKLDSECMPTRPVCDTQAGRCRACQANGECKSGVCVREGWPGDATVAGACAPVEKVCRVDPYNCLVGGDGSAAAPFCELDEATTCRGSYLVLAAKPGLTYKKPLQAEGKSFYVTTLGEGQATTPPSISAVSVRGSGSALVLSGVLLDHGRVPGNVATCRDGGRLWLRQSQVRGGDIGVSAELDCAGLDLNRVLVNGNDLDGVAITTGSTRYRILNSIIAENGKNMNSTAGGVSIGPGATGVFAFNTVVNNGVSGTGVAGGVICLGPGQLSDSIIDGNSFSSGQQSQVDSKCTLERVALGAMGSAKPGALPGKVDLDRRYCPLDTTSCCIDKGKASDAVPVDYYGAPRPARNGYDVGACEVQ